MAIRSGRASRPTIGRVGAHAARRTVPGLSKAWNLVKGRGGVRRRSVGIRAWVRMLGLEKTVVEGVELDEDDAIVVAVRPRYSQRDHCPHCRRRCPGYDLGEGRRRWRALDLGTTRCYLEAGAPRVECKVHGVVVAAIPWRAMAPGSRAASTIKAHGDGQHVKDRDLRADADRVADRRAYLRARERGGQGGT